MPELRAASGRDFPAQSQLWGPSVQPEPLWSCSCHTTTPLQPQLPWFVATSPPWTSPGYTSAASPPSLPPLFTRQSRMKGLTGIHTAGETAKTFFFFFCLGKMSHTGYSLASRKRQSKPAPLGMRHKGCPRERLWLPNPHLPTQHHQGTGGQTHRGHKGPRPASEASAKTQPQKDVSTSCPCPPSPHTQALNSSAARDPSAPTALGGTASAGSSSRITQSIYDFSPFEIWAFTTHRKEEESASKPVNL